VTWRSSGRKFGNTVTVDDDGNRFDSLAEMHRWKELQLEQRAGRITDLARQQSFLLVPTLRRPGERTEPALRLTVDFTYREGDRLVAEEFKGFEDTSWRIRRRLFLWLYGDSIELRVTGKGRR
jgi:hypothetical protein